MLQHDQFTPKEVWVISRIQVPLFVEDGEVDIYVLIDAGSGYIFGQLLYDTPLPSAGELKAMLKRARKSQKSWPKKLIVPKEDPAIDILTNIAVSSKFDLEIVPTPKLEAMLSPIAEGLRKHMMNLPQKPEYDSPPGEQAKDLLPDAYDPCPCASGKKYKFCCRVIMREVVEAMCAAEDGHLKEALEWLEKAKGKVGETAEVLCRYSIAYSFTNQQESDRYLQLALEKDSKHPRCHYILGLKYRQEEKFEKSIEEYELALKYYPATDKYHQNESLNNLANVYYEVGQIDKAKGAWEKALVMMPHDQLTKDNLLRFIYNNDGLTAEQRKPSPFVSRLL